MKDAKSDYWRKITIFKTLAVSKVVYLVLLTVIPNYKLLKVQIHFIWNKTPEEIKHKTLILDHKQGGLKCADGTPKIISPQCLWLKWLFDNSFHEWKVIPLFYIKKTFGNNFKVHTNLYCILKIKFYYQNFIKNSLQLDDLLSTPPELSLVFWAIFYGAINISKF